MSVLYLTEQGSSIKKTGNRLVVEKEGKKLLDIPLIKIKTILIYGNVQISTQAMAILFRDGIETSFLNMQGKLKGRLVPVKAKNVILRMNQYKKGTDKDFSLKIAKLIIHRKLDNYLSSMKRFKKYNPDIEFDKEMSGIEEYKKTIDRKNSTNALMGLEGISSVQYYKAYSRMFKGEIKFTNRTRRPPRDPANALLSLGYVMLGNEITSLLDAAGFDPYIGFLHQIDYGRPSLSLDIIEEFRQPVIDTCILNLCNKGVFKEKDFEKKKEGIFLLKDALKKFLLNYEKNMTEKQQKHNASFRELIRKQLNILSKALNSEAQYRTFNYY